MAKGPPSADSVSVYFSFVFLYCCLFLRLLFYPSRIFPSLYFIFPLFVILLPPPEPHQHQQPHKQTGAGAQMPMIMGNPAGSNGGPLGHIPHFPSPLFNFPPPRLAPPRLRQQPQPH